MPPETSSTRDFKIQALEHEAAQLGKWAEDLYPYYNLQWAKLKAWLEKRFELQKLKQPEKAEYSGDNYIFKVPKDRKLTQAEKDEIRLLKDTASQAQVAPDRPPSPEP